MPDTKPLPVYLLAFAVGPLDVIAGKTLPPTDLRTEPLPLRGVSIKGKSQQLKKSLDVAAQSLLSLEDYFGIAYPYGKMDIVAVPDFAAGAMENAGLVSFRDVLLFVDDAVLHPGCEGFVEPDVVPPREGDEIAEPLVRKLVRDDEEIGLL